MKGYADKVLRVNLTNGSVKKEELPEELVKKFLGGLALASYYLYKEVPKGADALGGENKLIFAPGVLVGTGLPTLSKSSLVFKSPLTGGFGRSVVGAKMGIALKKAGYDMLIIEGMAEKPKILRIKDEVVEILDADDLWGEDALETQKILKERFGENVTTAAIGPAGENLSLISGVDFEKRQAARCGIGAVMGSKKLKAMIVEGTGKIEYHDEEGMKVLARELTKKILENPSAKRYRDFGTGASYDWLNRGLGIFPSRNFQESFFRKAYEEKGYSDLDPERFVPTRRVARNPCPHCVIACSRVVEMKKYLPGTRVDGPEYETSYSLGSMLEIDDLDSVAYLNYLCDIYGLDTISAGVTIGWAMEAYEKGLLTKEDTDGLDLRFGNVEVAAEALRKMAYREGNLGKLLADGVKRASEKLGKESWKFAIHIKGLEFPGYDARGAKGLALAFAVSYRGACHLTAGNYPTELAGKWWVFDGVNRMDYRNKGFIVKFHEDLMQLYDTLGICKFARGVYTLDILPDILYAVTGMYADKSCLMTVGERMYNIARAFNIREGFSRKDDTLPWRIMHEPIPRGPSAGAKVSPNEFEHMLDEYYQARGWSKEGIPTKAKLISLDLDDIAEDVGI